MGTMDSTAARTWEAVNGLLPGDIVEIDTWRMKVSDPHDGWQYAYPETRAWVHAIVARRVDGTLDWVTYDVMVPGVGLARVHATSVHPDQTMKVIFSQSK